MVLSSKWMQLNWKFPKTCPAQQNAHGQARQYFGMKSRHSLHMHKEKEIYMALFYIIAQANNFSESLCWCCSCEKVKPEKHIMMHFSLKFSFCIFCHLPWMELPHCFFSHIRCMCVRALRSPNVIRMCVCHFLFRLHSTHEHIRLTRTCASRYDTQAERGKRRDHRGKERFLKNWKTFAPKRKFFGKKPITHTHTHSHTDFNTFFSFTSPWYTRVVCVCLWSKHVCDVFRLEQITKWTVCCLTLCTFFPSSSAIVRIQ